MPLIPVNDIRLNVEQAGSGPPLVLLHGFTGSAASWSDLIPYWMNAFTTYAVDLIGHGRSDAPAKPERYRMERCVEDLIALFDRLGIERAALLGYSMGGRVALHLTLAIPERIRVLVLESASPGMRDPAERAGRIEGDEVLARLIEQEGLAAFVDRWERLPLFASQQRLPHEVRERLRRQRLAGNPVGLANSLRGLGAGAMVPVWDRLGELTMPVLYVAGEFDAKYLAVGKQAAGSMPNARVIAFDDAGHTVHLEQPARFGRIVSAYVSNQPTLVSRPSQAAWGGAGVLFSVPTAPESG